MRVRNSLVFGVLAGAAVFTLSACGNQDPIATGVSTTAAAPTTTTAAPAATTAGTTDAPDADSPTVAPAKTGTKSTTTTAAPVSGNGCPVTAAKLQKVSGLTGGAKIDASSIKCAENWATAGVIAATPAQQGDGVIVFSYRNGTWTKKGEGSEINCSEFGMPKSTGLCFSA